MVFTIGCSKGGVGKTSLSAAIAMEWEHFGVGTNESFHTWTEIIDEQRLLECSPFEEFPDFSSEQLNVLIDLSGDVTEQSISITSAVAQSDVVIVPVIPDRQAIFSAANYIMTIAPYNSNIIVVANMLQKGAKERFSSWQESKEFLMIKELLASQLPDELQHIPVFPMKHTKAFKAIYTNQAGISEMSQSNPLLKHAYSEVNSQLRDIMEAIESYE
jgi:MinD-like ATPase involved in chromosome partitioning or flagellar assembly